MLILLGFKYLMHLNKAPPEERYLLMISLILFIYKDLRRYTSSKNIFRWQLGGKCVRKINNITNSYKDKKSLFNDIINILTLL